MDHPTKKRKPGLSQPDQAQTLTPSDFLKMIEPLSREQLLEILQTAFATHPGVLAAVRDVADRDVTKRKLFIHSLHWAITCHSLRAAFEGYGEVEDADVILHRTGISKGYGFVTYKHIDGAIMALKNPLKEILGSVAVAALSADTALRKICVGNVPEDMPSETLLSVFASFWEIEDGPLDGPLGFSKAIGKSNEFALFPYTGFALFVYKTQEAAQASLVEPTKIIDGRRLTCELVESP